MKTRLELPMAAKELIPHKKPIRLINRLLECRENKGVAEAIVEPDCILLDQKGNLERAAMIELIAQAFAVLKGYEDIKNNASVKNGFLVGLRKVKIIQNVNVGDRLNIHIKKVAAIEGFAVAEGKIKKDDELIAVGSIKLWIAEGGLG